jgi:hypothetical protein
MHQSNVYAPILSVANRFWRCSYHYGLEFLLCVVMDTVPIVAINIYANRYYSG